MVGWSGGRVVDLVQAGYSRLRMLNWRRVPVYLHSGT